MVFKMPDIGEGVEEGEVVAWLKKEGELVKKDEPVLKLMTDKATVELPSPFVGRVVKLYYREGEIAKKGLPLYEVEVGEEASPHPVLASPQVRHIAQEKGINLTEIHGSGSEGRILPQDLEKGKKLEEVQVTPLHGIPLAMALHMSESKQKTPHFSYFDQADAEKLLAKEKEGKIGFMPYFLKAITEVLGEFPLLNSSYDAEKRGVIFHPHHHIGIAIASPQGLIIPVLKNVETLSFSQISENYRKLIEAAKGEKLAPEDFKGATFTLSNFGALSPRGKFATPIIPYPQAGILATARIQPQPAVYNGQLTVRNLLNCSWSFDHRLIDGKLAAQISESFIQKIENVI
jgi:pyruvate/2-oxoglutarate dehydrogenase complex dihydrolipoamide acyltransferase (E2) component